MPIANSMNKIIIWSDGCASQFRSRFVFYLLHSLYPEKELEWNYNEAHHGKGPIDGIGGTLKNQVFQHVKSGRVIISSPKDFALATNKYVPSISTIYTCHWSIFQTNRNMWNIVTINSWNSDVSSSEKEKKWPKVFGSLSLNCQPKTNPFLLNFIEQQMTLSFVVMLVLTEVITIARSAREIMQMIVNGCNAQAAINGIVV